MAKVLSSISGNLISAASAGYAPTNGADVSAIASAYQVVSATGTQLYASTAHVTSINNAPISASRAGNAANAAMASSAYYDGTGRLISALPDSATVSSIASSYAASAASSKQDSSAMSSYALSADVSSTISTVSTNSASWASSISTASATSYKQNGTQLVTFTGVASADSKPLIAQTIQAGAVQSIGTSNFFYGPSAKPFTANTAGIYAPLQYATGACLAMDGGTYRAYYKGNEWFISDYGSNRSGAVRAEVHNTRGIHISGSNTAGVGFDLLTSGLNFTDNTGTTSMTPANIAEWKSCESTVSTQSANWGGSALALSAGPGVVLSMVDNTLVASADETVLWTGAINTTAQAAAFSEATNHFERVRVYIQAFGTTDQSTEIHDLSLVYRTGNNNDAISYVQGVERHSNVTTQSTIYIHFTGAYGVGAKLENGSKWVGSSYTEGVSSYPFKLVKVVGVNRIAGA